MPDVIPLFRGHTAVVLDTDWHPFNDRIIASGSDDGKIFIWEVPKDFTLFTDAEEPADVTPVSKLAGHSRYVARPQERRMPCRKSLIIAQEGRPSPFQPRRREHPRLGIW